MTSDEAQMVDRAEMTWSPALAGPPAREAALDDRTAASAFRLPILASVLLAAAFWTFNTLPFIAEDCYFYAIIARNLALRGVQSYWGTELTNGVHPLWTLLFGAYSWVVSRVSVEALYRGAFGVPLSLALLAGGALNWACVAERTRLPRSILVFPSLVYLSIFGLVYSEAHVSYFALSLLCRLACDEEHEAPTPIRIGLAAAVVFLARLDNLFFVAAFGVWYALRRRSVPVIARAGIAAAIPAVIYVAVNAIWFGGLAPVSGYLKSTFPVPFLQGLRFVGGIQVMLSGYSVPFGWVPLAIGMAVALVWRARLTGLQTLLYPLVIGTAGHAIYTGFFTAGFTDWYWYYVLPMMLASWSLACAAQWFWIGGIDRVAQWAAVLVLAAGLFGSRMHTPTEQQLDALRTLRVVRELGIDRSVILTSEWPGTVGFYTHNDIIGADMLTSNRNLVKRMIESPNAADVLFDEARANGTPVQYVLYNGGVFLRPSDDQQHIDFMDPRMLENRRHHVIGHIDVGQPIANRNGILVWKLPQP